MISYATELEVSGQITGRTKCSYDLLIFVSEFECFYMYELKCD